MQAALRVLVIDDSADDLQVTSAQLLQYRPGWAVEGTTVISDAFSLINHATPFDVIVSEFLPDVGRDLLTAMAYYSPHSMRLVLTRMVNARCLVAAQRYAHRHLCKPCPIETVLATIDRLLPSMPAISEDDRCRSTATPPRYLRCVTTALTPRPPWDGIGLKEVKRTVGKAPSAR
jgi:DNA-binding NtrC family response regulator